MRRRLSNIFATVFLLSATALAILWIRSHWRYDGLTFALTDGRVTMIALHRGFIRIEHAAPWPHPPILGRVELTIDSVRQGTYLTVGPGSFSYHQCKWL